VLTSSTFCLSVGLGKGKKSHIRVLYLYTVFGGRRKLGKHLCPSDEKLTKPTSGRNLVSSAVRDTDFFRVADRDRSRASDRDVMKKDLGSASLPSRSRCSRNLVSAAVRDTDFFSVTNRDRGRASDRDVMKKTLVPRFYLLIPAAASTLFPQRFATLTFSASPIATVAAPLIAT
jgi:hypothetical protein